MIAWFQHLFAYLCGLDGREWLSLASDVIGLAGAYGAIYSALALRKAKKGIGRVHRLPSILKKLGKLEGSVRTAAQTSNFGDPFRVSIAGVVPDVRLVVELTDGPTRKIAGELQQAIAAFKKNGSDDTAARAVVSLVTELKIELDAYLEDKDWEMQK